MDSTRVTDQTRQTSKAELLKRLTKAKISLKKLERSLRAIPEQQPLLLHVNEHEAVELQEYLDQYRKGHCRGKLEYTIRAKSSGFARSTGRAELRDRS